MQTLTEMNKADQETRERAFLYEQLTNERIGLVGNIARLEAECAMRLKDVGVLEDLRLRCTDLSPECETGQNTTTLGWQLPSHTNVRDVIAFATANAIGRAHLKHDDAARQLDTYRKRLAYVEQELTAFTD